MVNAINNFSIPDLTPSDQLFSRTYFLISAPLESVQLVVKVAKAILMSSIAFLFLGSSKSLNQLHIGGWKEVKLLSRVILYSLMGIVAPKEAVRQKAQFLISLLQNHESESSSSESPTIPTNAELKLWAVMGMVDGLFQLGATYLLRGLSSGMVRLKGDGMGVTGYLAAGAEANFQLAKEMIDLRQKILFAY